MGFPQLLWSNDGKHIRIVCSNRSGSLFYNYKGFFSTVLLAIVDANYKFMFIDVGSYGKGDPGIFERSSLGKMFYYDTLLPPPGQLPYFDLVLFHIFVGDDAFRLPSNMLKPYPRERAVVDNMKAIFNYRLSRACRTSENAFGLLSHTAINLLPKTVNDVVIICCCLHILRDAYGTKSHAPNYEPDPIAQEPSTDNFINFARARRYANFEGFAIRDSFAAYFSNDGRMCGQDHRVNRTDQN